MLIKSKRKTPTSTPELSPTPAVSRPSAAVAASAAKTAASAKGAGNKVFGNRYLERVHEKLGNETLVGPEVCVRAGLFRHPSDCQKFYECYWDRWIHQYTLHVFKCPVHLVYDDYITACNWPFDGPQCVPHELVKLYAQPEE